MSCSTVSEVKLASSPDWWAWMSCGRAGYLAGEALLTKQQPSMLREPLVVVPAKKPEPAFYTGLWSAFLQAFTVDDIYHRKIK
jgi:hypothetical protein